MSAKPFLNIDHVDKIFPSGKRQRVRRVTGCETRNP